jgi:pimeloyl-ACP methyl ester carboxylesterase
VTRTLRFANVVFVVLATASVGGGAITSRSLGPMTSKRLENWQARVQVWRIRYRAGNGSHRNAYVLLPPWYGPKNNPSIPLIISPHGRGLSGRQNARIWGSLPATGSFAVVSPDGQGRRLMLYSWGYGRQIEDLASMPRLVEQALPWLRLEHHRIYAFGGSMGGQEVLLLVARHPHLLAGAASFDSISDLALQYRNFPLLACDRACLRKWVDPIGIGLQGLARLEVGGSPASDPAAYAQRSPLTYARRLAFSGVPLQFWWSKVDRVVVDQANQSGKLFWKIRLLNPKAPVEAFVGFWVHSAEMREGSRLPLALATFGLLPTRFNRRPPALHFVPPP